MDKKIQSNIYKKKTERKRVRKIKDSPANKIKWIKTSCDELLNIQLNLNIRNQNGVKPQIHSYQRFKTSSIDKVYIDGP